MIRTLAALAILAPQLAFAQDITVTGAFSPLAPPTAMAHAAYMTITNDGDVARNLVGVSAGAYAMVHLHQTKETDGMATMIPVHQITIQPGQSLTLEQGATHVMLMRPKEAQVEGGTIALTLEFANGENVPFLATVQRTHGGS